MSSSVQLKALGLNTSPNAIEVPAGSLVEASNIIIRRDDVVEPRRGMKLYGNDFGSIGDRAKALFVYKTRLLRHYASTLQFDDGNGNFTSFAGTYVETEPGLRIKSIEANGNFYFTTADGIKKISASSPSDLDPLNPLPIVSAGAVKAVDFTGKINYIPGNLTGFLPQDSAVAYRHLWSYKDNNDNLIQGTPSQRLEIFNPLLTLMINDFNRLLEILVSLNQGASLVGSDDYVTLLHLENSADATELRTNLISLASKIDNNIIYADVSGTAPLDMVGQTYDVTTNVGTINFLGTATPSNYWHVGSKIFLSGFTAAINGGQVISSITDGASPKITFSVVTADIPATAIPGAATIVSNEYRSITQPVAPSTPATDADLVDQQNYLDAIAAQLQAEPPGTIPTYLEEAYLANYSTTTTATVTLDITIPDGITSDYFLQIYRSAITQATGTTVLSDLTPNDEMQLVYEAYPTAAQLAAKEVIVEDVTPDAFRGANLYTNEVTGEGAAQANDIPPFAKDINRFKNCIFFANTKTRQRLLLSLLGATNITDGAKLVISDGTTSNTYTFVRGVQEVTDVQTIVGTTLNGKYFYFYSANDETAYYAYYTTGISGTTTGASPITVTSNGHGLSNGDSITIQGSNSTPSIDGTYTVSGVTTNTFDITTTFSLSVASTTGWILKNIAGKTGIRVDVFTTDTAAQVAQRTSSAIDVYGYDFQTEILTTPDRVRITNTNEGSATDATAQTSGFTISVVTQGVGEDVTNRQILISSVVSTAQAVDLTSKSLIRVVNHNSSEIVYGYYLSGALSVPGQMLFEGKSLNDNPVYFLVSDSATGSSFSPDLSPGPITITAFSVANPTQATTSAPHGLTNGDKIIIVGSTTTPDVDGVQTVSVTGASTFTIPFNVTIGGTAKYLKVTDAISFSNNEQKKNRVYYSKPNEPEAVPLVNFFDVGASDRAILRIFPLRDSLFIYKEDGLYRVSGENAPFQLSLFDSSCNLLAPDSLDVANNIIYGWTTQGIQCTTEAGVNTISRPIDVDILKLATNQYTNFKTVTWGVGYESDNSYIVCTLQKTTDTVAKIAYRYGILTNTWTTFDWSKTCGIVNTTDDKLYLGAGDTNFIEQERKNFTRYDYADRELSKTITLNNYSGSRIRFSVVSDVAIGDVLVQEQTLSVYEFNMLLKKLDIDPGVPSSDYFSTLETSGGDDLRTSIEDLATKLDSDSLGFTNYAAAIASYSGSISTVSVGSTTVTVTTSSPHNLLSGRLVTISGVGGGIVPDIDGDYVITVIGSSTFTIQTRVITAGTGGTFSTQVEDFQDIKGSYDILISKLNSDSIVAFGNYSTIDTTTVLESVVMSIDNVSKTLTLRDNLQFVLGPVKIYKSISCNHTYAPNTLGDPLGWKHIRQATVMFDSKAFTQATVGFATDIFPAFKRVDFDGDGNGIFGMGTFGSNFFGGTSNSVPFRTYIPRDCQRCRFMVVRFSHSVAREKFSLYGITLTGEMGQSERAYRS